MPNRSMRTALSALAAAATLAVAIPAQAKLIGTDFDPVFFDGVGTFFVPDSPSPCLALGAGFHVVNPGFEGCSGVVLLNASVNVSDGGGTAHLSLPPPVPSASAISGIVLDPQAASILVGVNSGLIPILADACSGDLCFYDWFIAWDSGMDEEGGDLNNRVYLFRAFCGEERPNGMSRSASECGPIVQFGDPADHVKFREVPEPGSLALLLGALGIGWVVRRRKAAA